MVSEEVKGQHVMLWSVCVSCLLPALVNAHCAKFRFPTANHDGSSDGNVTLSVPENQDVTIPFSLDVRTCNGRNPTFTITVAKKENDVFTDICQLVVAGSRPVSLPEGRCGKQTGEGNYFVRKFMDRGDQTVWRWRMSYLGVVDVERRVQLRVYRSTIRPRNGARSMETARAILIVAIALFSIIVIKLSVLLFRRRYEGRVRTDCCTCCTPQHVGYSIQYRPQPMGSENERPEEEAAMTSPSEPSKVQPTSSNHTDPDDVMLHMSSR